VSQYRNVSKYRKTGRWIAKVHSNGGLPVEKTIHLGYHDTAEEAARVADVAKRILNALGLLRKWDGQFNFDGQPPPSVPFAQILQMLLNQGVITAQQARQIITPHD
jgi:hypothetical protein